MTKPPEKNRFSKKTILISMVLIIGSGAYIFWIIQQGIRLNAIKRQIAELKAGEVAIVSNPWVPPSGFYKYSDKIAIKWSDKNSFTCKYQDVCIQLEVVTESGCSNLYVEISKEDDNGNNVGWTNETTTGLAPNQKAKLLFEATKEEENTIGKITKISCY